MAETSASTTFRVAIFDAFSLDYISAVRLLPDQITSYAFLVRIFLLIVSAMFQGSVNNSRLFFNAQLSILDATEANDQLQSAALFGALASPPPDNALDTLGSALADAQSKLAAFVVSNFTGNTANDTAALAAANDAVAKAIDQAHNLNCTTS
ncbi:hypothetical protein DFH09DRAFT_1378090 [Mycena vulgaris]|nr:hypothetical protein DFH09DRAFT_1378090 [Mycena vulgaris]